MALGREYNFLKPFNQDLSLSKDLVICNKVKWGYSIFSLNPSSSGVQTSSSEADLCSLLAKYCINLFNIFARGGLRGMWRGSLLLNRGKGIHSQTKALSRVSLASRTFMRLTYNSWDTLSGCFILLCLRSCGSFCLGDPSTLYQPGKCQPISHDAFLGEV